jgi:hypothetical protein
VTICPLQAASAVLEISAIAINKTTAGPSSFVIRCPFIPTWLPGSKGYQVRNAVGENVSGYLEPVSVDLAYPGVDHGRRHRPEAGCRQRHQLAIGAASDKHLDDGVGQNALTSAGARS